MKVNVYHYMIAFLLILAGIGIAEFGIGALIHLLLAVVTVTILAVPISYFRFKKFKTPLSSVITGLFVGTVLFYSSIWYLTVLAAAAAVASKHLFSVVVLCTKCNTVGVIFCLSPVS